MNIFLKNIKNNDIYLKSIWQSKVYLNYFLKKIYVFNYKNKIDFDIFLCSFIFCKFLNNCSNNYNYSKIYHKFLKIYLKISKKFSIKGLFLLLFLNFNVLFISFFEVINVKVAGRFLKVPNPILFNKSYRIVTKKFVKILKKKKEHSFFDKVLDELYIFNKGASMITIVEKHLLGELVENRMFGHFRWKYIKLRNFTIK